MDNKTKSIIGLIGSALICLFGVYHLLVELPAATNLLIIPIVFAVTGFIGSLLKLKKNK